MRPGRHNLKPALYIIPTAVLTMLIIYATPGAVDHRKDCECVRLDQDMLLKLLRDKRTLPETINNPVASKQKPDLVRASLPDPLADSDVQARQSRDELRNPTDRPETARNPEDTDAQRQGHVVEEYEEEISDKQLLPGDKQILKDNGNNPKYNPDFWKRHFKVTCSKFAMHTDAFKLKPVMVNKILVDERHQILFGQMAKVASTNLGRIFAIMAGLFNSTDPDDIDPEQVHTIINHRETHLSEFPINDIIYRINTYFKFVFVRDPFERLLSAFMDKFSPPRPGYFEKLAKNIVRIYRKTSYHWKPIAFPEFIEYVSEAGRVLRSDNHWMPFHELSRPCELGYDFVGTIYTLHDDVQHVLRTNGLTGVVKVPEQKAARSLHETDKYLQQYYSQVPKSVLKKLYDTYLYDYELFNLTLPACIKTMLKL